MTRCKDYSVVTVESNIHESTPKSNVSRWSSKDKKKVLVPLPHVIAQYNENMGGADRMDQNINVYRVSIRKKNVIKSFLSCARLEPGAPGYKTNIVTTTPRPDKMKRLMSDSDQP